MEISDEKEGTSLEDRIRREVADEKGSVRLVEEAPRCTRYQTEGRTGGFDEKGLVGGRARG